MLLTRLYINLLGNLKIEQMKFKKLTQPLIVLFKKRKCLSINLSMYESCQYLRNVPDGPIDTFVLLNNNTRPG